MTKKVVLAALLASTPILAQTAVNGSRTFIGNLRVKYPNAVTTGTVLNRLAKLTGSPAAAVRSSAGDTSEAVGIVVAGDGTSGDAEIAFTGKAPCEFDGAATAGNYVQISATLAGACHDSGAATLPAGGQVLGRVTTTGAAAGVYEVDLTSRTNYPAATALTTLTGSLRVAYPNDVSSGTTLNRLAKLTGAPSTAVILAASDTTSAVGIVVAGAGTTGIADIAFTGKASCVFDGATTAGNYVQISATLAGACHDSGAATLPGSGQILGRVTTTNAAAGVYEVDLTARTNYPAATALTTLTGSLRVAYPNDASSGTTLNRLAKLTGAPSTAAILAPSDTTGAIGIVVTGAGTTGIADIAFTGKASCVFDGATTAGNYVQISATLEGACHDSGTATLPGSGQILGRVTTTNAAAGVYEVDLTARTNYPAATALTTLTGSLRIAYPNDASSGTALNRLAKLTGVPSSAVILAASDATGAVGIVVAGAGTTGIADIAFTGKASCLFDGATTAGNYVGISSSVAGACHDAGPAVPASGQIIGRVTTTNGVSGTYEVDLTPRQLSAGGVSGGPTVGVSKIWLPVAGCQNTTAFLLWDTPTANPAVAACITGSNVQKGVAEFADGANSLSLQITLALPSDFTGAIDARFKWTTLATTGSVVWQIATACVADAETDDPTFNPASPAIDAAKGSALQTNDAAVVGINTAGCAAGELMHVKVFRDPAHTSDDLAATARLIGVELTTRRTL